MASPRFPEPPPSMEPTPIAEVDALLQKLHAQREAWVQTPIPRRIQLLHACVQASVAAAEGWVEAACRAKGIDPDSPRAGEEWLGGPVTTIRNMRLLIDTLERNGQPNPSKVERRSDGQVVARVFPADLFDKLMFTGFTADVWMEPGHEATQGMIYRRKAAGEAVQGRLALVLGAGNVASIGPMDALYKLFAEDEVVVLKTNPVNAYLGPWIEQSLAPLVEAGVFGVVHGGAEVGQHLTNHELVETIHITGSDRTHDMIIWGSTPEEQAANKAAGTPVNTRPITSELGCVTPVLIVPGPWSEKQLDYQARHVAAMVTNNASFNCNAAKVLVTAKGWPLRERFIEKVHAVLAGMPSRKAYYPGAKDRYQGFLDHYPQAKPLSPQGEEVVPWTVIPDVAPDSSEYALTNEAFCGVLAEVTLDATTAGEFLDAATTFANEECWGTLSTMMLIHPKSEKEFADAFDRAIANLRFGGIGVNVWAGVIYGLVVTTWGAHPGHPLEDIRSGRGVVHNTYLFEHPQKSVVKAPFVINPTPAWFSDHKTQAELGRALVRFEAKPGWRRLPAVIAAALRG